MRFRASFLSLIFVSLLGCATQHSKDVAFVEQRVQQLKTLEKYPATVCDIETRPTPTSIARYIQLNPAEAHELKGDVWKFRWRQTENRCEISGGSSLKAIKMQRAVVEAAFCLPLQVFFVNSPFDEVKISSDAISREDKLIRVSSKPGSDLGYYLDTGNMTVLTRTSSKGELSAHYAQFKGEWLPDQIEQNTATLKILLDGIVYSEKQINNRRLIDSMWISIGSVGTTRHSQILVSNCQRM